MSFTNKSTNTFFTILAGKFSQRVPEGTPGAVERVNKLGKVVHEVSHDSFTGILTDIRITESDYGRSWNFDFSSDGKIYTLQLSYSNSFATALLKMLPNIDVSNEFTMTPSVKMVDGKSQSALFVNQDNKAVKHAYTKAEPNGLPDMEQIMVKGQPTWDDTKRLEFLTAMVSETILPKLTGAVSEATEDSEKPLPTSFEDFEPEGGVIDADPEDIGF